MRGGATGASAHVDYTGILDSLDPAVINSGRSALPPAKEGSPNRVAVEVDSLLIGKVWITYRLAQGSQHGNPVWFWQPVYAELGADR